MDPRKTGQAHANRKHLLGKVEECIRAANQAVSDSAHVIQTHDAFVREVGAQFEQRDARINAQGEWLDKVETGATAALELATALDDRLNALVDEVAILRAREAAFASLTLWQRLRLAITGHWPVPVTAIVTGMGTEAHL